MDRIRRYLPRMCVVIIIICVILAATYRQAQIEKDLPTVVSGMPGIYTDPSFSADRITIDQILADQSRLYLLDEYNGYIYVFDLDGNYQYTIILYDYMNGAFRMAVTKEKLYVADPHDDVYIFSDDTFVEFRKRQDAQDLLTSIDFEKTSETYKMRFDSIYNVKNDTCVIKRSIFAVKNPKIVLPVLFFLFLAIYIYRRKKK